MKARRFKPAPTDPVFALRDHVPEELTISECIRFAKNATTDKPHNLQLSPEKAQLQSRCEETLRVADEYEAKKALTLLIIHDNDLYLATHKTFKAFYEARHISKSQTFKLLAFARILLNIIPFSQAVFLPAFWQAQVLVKVKATPDMQLKVWNEAICMGAVSDTSFAESIKKYFGLLGRQALEKAKDHSSKKPLSKLLGPDLLSGLEALAVKLEMSPKELIPVAVAALLVRHGLIASDETEAVQAQSLDDIATPAIPPNPEITGGNVSDFPPAEGGILASDTNTLKITPCCPGITVVITPNSVEELSGTMSGNGTLVLGGALLLSTGFVKGGTPPPSILSKIQPAPDPQHPEETAQTSEVENDEKKFARFQTNWSAIP